MLFAETAFPRFLYLDDPVPAHLADALRSACRGVGGDAKFLSPKNCHSFRTLWGLPAPTPRVTFSSAKKSPKRRQNQGFGILFLRRPYLIWDISVPNYILLSNLQFDGQRDFACRPFEGVHVSLRCYTKQSAWNAPKILRRIKRPETSAARGGGRRTRLSVRGKRPMRGGRHHRKTQGSRGDHNTTCGGT